MAIVDNPLSQLFLLTYTLVASVVVLRATALAPIMRMTLLAQRGLR